MISSIGCARIPDMPLEPYSYCYLRYVHDPRTGEFANVGVLLWAPQSRYLAFICQEKTQRLQHFFHEFEDKDYANVLRHVKKEFQKIALKFQQGGELPLEGVPRHARDIALCVIPHDDAVFQWSLSMGGLTADPQKELDDLHFQIAGKFLPKSADQARRNDQAIYGQYYKSTFESDVVKPHIKPHEVVAPYHSHRFPLAWLNGVWNCYQVLSLDLRNPKKISERCLQWDSAIQQLSRVPEKPKLHLLLAAPDESNLSAYRKGRDLLYSSQLAEIVEEDEAADFCKELVENISKFAVV